MPPLDDGSLMKEMTGAQPWERKSRARRGRYRAGGGITRITWPENHENARHREGGLREGIYEKFT